MIPKAGSICATLGTLVLGGCYADGSPETVLHRDSAGVRVVESRASLWAEGEGWTIDSVPLLDLTLTGAGPYHEFGRVPDAARRIDGSIVVLDEALGEIRAYASDGSFQWVTGRRGDGPGEYRRLAGVSVVSGDSLFVFDSTAGRVTIIGPSGNVARVMTLPRTDRYSELYPLEDGSFVGVGYGADALMARPLGPYRVPMIVTRLDGSGQTIDTLGVMPGFSGYLEEGRDWAPILPAQAHLAVSSAGVVMGSPDESAFRRYDRAGRLEQVSHAPVLARPLTDEQEQLEREAMIRPQTPPEARAVVSRLPAPEFWPSMDDLMIDPLGYVWMAEYKSALISRDRSTRWHVFAPDGAWLGTVRTPERFILREIGVDYLLGWYDGRGGAYSVHVLVLNR